MAELDDCKLVGGYCTTQDHSYHQDHYALRFKWQAEVRAQNARPRLAMEVNKVSISLRRLDN